MSAENPAPDIAWTPKYALSAGPVLLKDGKCPFDFTETPKGADYYLSNYEIMPYDIFGVGVSPDRTAVGSTADGRRALRLRRTHRIEPRGHTHRIGGHHEGARVYGCREFRRRRFDRYGH